MPKSIELGLRPKLDVEAMTVTMNVQNKAKEIKASSTYHWADLPEDIQAQLQLAGMSTVLQQRGSSIKEDPEAKLEYMDEVFEMFTEGRYEKEREGGARVIAPLVEVLADLKGVSPAVIQKSLKAYDEEFVAKLKEKHADAIEAVIAKRATTEEVDLTDLV